MFGTGASELTQRYERKEIVRRALGMKLPANRIIDGAQVIDHGGFDIAERDSEHNQCGNEAPPCGAGPPACRVRRRIQTASEMLVNGKSFTTRGGATIPSPSNPRTRFALPTAMVF